MIKLMEILNIDSLTYGEPQPKHIAKMKKGLGMFDGFPVQDYMSNPPNKNSSEKTKSEIKYIQGIERDEDFIKSADDIPNYFAEYIEGIGYKFPKKHVKKILDDSGIIVLKLKYYYNRPRPHQLAEYYGLKEFENFDLPSMKTPSYPSGHSTQGHLIAELLGKKYPNHYDKFKGLANMISASRLMARAHYPSDCEFGEEVAQHIIGKIK